MNQPVKAQEFWINPFDGIADDKPPINGADFIHAIEISALDQLRKELSNSDKAMQMSISGKLAVENQLLDCKKWFKASEGRIWELEKKNDQIRSELEVATDTIGQIATEAGNRARRIKELEHQLKEQCQLNAMGAQREIKLKQENEKYEHELFNVKQSNTEGNKLISSLESQLTIANRKLELCKRFVEIVKASMSNWKSHNTPVTDALFYDKATELLETIKGGRVYERIWSLNRKSICIRYAQRKELSPRPRIAPR